MRVTKMPQVKGRREEVAEEAEEEGREDVILDERGARPRRELRHILEENNDKSERAEKPNLKKNKK